MQARAVGEINSTDKRRIVTVVAIGRIHTSVVWDPMARTLAEGLRDPIHNLQGGPEVSLGVERGIDFLCTHMG